MSQYSKPVVKSLVPRGPIQGTLLNEEVEREEGQRLVRPGGFQPATFQLQGIGYNTVLQPLPQLLIVHSADTSVIYCTLNTGHI